MEISPEEIYTVSAANKMARFVLEQSFPSLWVEGEISNYHHHGSGHRYFTLKDDESQLKCAMWRSHATGLRFEPEDGLKVIAHGILTIYERGGSYQLSVRRLVPSGTGELELAFRQLKEKLEKEGLFDPAHKKRLPTYPLRIGVVTSPTGAVIHDIIRVIKGRNPRIKIILWPTEVQGGEAPRQLAEGVRQLNEFGEVEVIIIGRGGGSLEDLWAFNDERVVRAIRASTIPVISAVGHEVDLTLADLAADYSAPTPSAAAETVAWSLNEFLDQLIDNLRRIKRSAAGALEDGRERLVGTIRSRIYTRPEAMLEPRLQYLDQQGRLLRLLSEKRFDTFRKAAGFMALRLEALSPLAVLARGYCVARRDKDKAVIRSIGIIAPGDRMETIVGDGSIVSLIEKTAKKE